MHEVFLTRLAQHPIFRKDNNFKVFLEYEQDVSVYNSFEINITITKQTQGIVM